MNPQATNRTHLLRIANLTLDTLGGGHFPETLAEAVPTEELEVVDTERDVIVNALVAALDWARLEDDVRDAEISAEGVPGSSHDVPYLPSNQVLALIQSAYDEYIEQQGITEEPFDPTDVRWIAVAWEKLRALLRGKRPFIPHRNSASFRYDLPEDAVVALFADWGTGEATAQRVMQQIRRAEPTHAIHLGDVYHSGTPREVRSRFLDVIDREGPPASGCQYLALNSNHEMYSGGYGYFDTTLPRFGQEASYFNLNNRYWQLIGLDSGYEDHGLQDPQSEWLSAQLEAQGPRAILLSHHQIFSPYEKRASDRRLDRKVSPLLPQVYAWFWGHEHKAIIFGEHRGIKARCIGNGAIPFRVPFGPRRFPNVPVQHVDERAAPGSSDDGIHGFALLRFRSNAIEVSYVDEFGTTVFSERL